MLMNVGRYANGMHSSAGTLTLPSSNVLEEQARHGCFFLPSGNRKLFDLLEKLRRVLESV